MSSESHVNESLMSPTKSVKTIQNLAFPEMVSSVGSCQRAQKQDNKFLETIIANAECEFRQACECFEKVLKTQYGWLTLEGGVIYCAALHALIPDPKRETIERTKISAIIPWLSFQKSLPEKYHIVFRPMLLSEAKLLVNISHSVLRENTFICCLDSEGQQNSDYNDIIIQQKYSKFVAVSTKQTIPFGKKGTSADALLLSIGRLSNQIVLKELPLRDILLAFDEHQLVPKKAELVQALSIFSKYRMVLEDNSLEISRQKLLQAYGDGMLKMDVAKCCAAPSPERLDTAEEQAKKLLLSCDHIRANLNNYDESVLIDNAQGHWELWEPMAEGDERIKLEQPLIARNPAKDIHDGVVGIDFGTKSTVVVCQEGNDRFRPRRIGTSDLMQQVQSRDYENPTTIEFIDKDIFVQSYTAREGRPFTRWLDITISYQAVEDMLSADVRELSAYFTEIKQWAGDSREKMLLCDRHGHEFHLSPYDRLEEGDFDPVEIYAYYLGLYINNMHEGISLDYLLSYPVTYSKDIRERIRGSFERGLRKSLPPSLLKDEEAMRRFSVRNGVSEPEAYAVTALQKYNFLPEDDTKVPFAVFDFGGGTTDFDYGIWRAADGSRSERKFDYVIEHCSNGGDHRLGGENILECLAYEVFKDNQNAMREMNASFTQPTGCTLFPGSTMLVRNDSRYARQNMKLMMECLRSVWETCPEPKKKPEDSEEVESQAVEVKIDIFNNQGELLSNKAFVYDPEKLERMICDKIDAGIRQFFVELLKAFRGKGAMVGGEKIAIFLAGNSSKSPRVQRLFRKYMEEYGPKLDESMGASVEEPKKLEPKPVEEDDSFSFGDLDDGTSSDSGVSNDTPRNETGESSMSSTPDGGERFELFPPLGTEEARTLQESRGYEFEPDLEEPTGKTGVAYGLIYCRPAGKIKVIAQQHGQQGDEQDIPFQYYLGDVRRGKLVPRLSPDSGYGEWVFLCDADDEVFEVYYTTLPEAQNGQLTVRTQGVSQKRLLCDRKDDACVFIRATSPYVFEYVLATAKEDDSLEELLGEPVRVDLR